MDVGAGLRLVSVGPVEGGPSAFGEAIRSAAAELGRAKLVIVYLPILPRAELRAFLAAAAGAARGATIVGATTGGAGFTERGITRNGAVGAVLGGDVCVRTADARDLRNRGREALHRALASLDVGTARCPSMLILMDAYAIDGETLVSALREHTPIACRCFGATAGDDWAFRRTYVFHDGEVLADTAVFVLLESPSKMALDVLHGFSPAPDAREMRITAIEGSVLKSLDGRPAADVYLEELVRLGLAQPGEDVVRALFRSEIGIATPFGEQLKIRAPLAVDPDGAITLAGSLPAGRTVRVVVATPNQLVNAAEQLAARVRRRIGAPLRGALVFDCAARMKLLERQFEAEARAFAGAGRSPTLGIASYGEIAKFGGSVEGFHNTTAVMVGW